MPVTLKDVAREAGVSHTSVSNAYRHPERLSPAVRANVLAVAGRLGYRGPDPVAASMRTRRVGALGVLFTEAMPFAFSDPAAMELLRGIADVTAQSGVGLTLLPAPQGVDADAIAMPAVDGYLVYSLGRDHPALDAARRLERPVVVVDQPLGIGDGFIGVDDRGGARAATEHLIALGHRRIAVLVDRLRPDGRTGPVDARRRRSATFPVERERLDGIAEALSAARLDPARVPIHECGSPTAAAGQAAMAVLLDRPVRERPTAIVALADTLAVGACRAAAARGMHVPSDLSVVGFDDAPIAVEHRPALTTVHQPLVEKGRRAARLLLALIDGHEVVRTDLLPTELIVRGSTAPAPGTALR